MSYILGIDEAGRGAWAGPLVIGAVILGGYEPEGITDSKLLSREQRIKFSKLIHKHSSFTAIGWVSAEEVDSLGLTKATTTGIKRALEKLPSADTEIIIDGNINYLKDYKNSRSLIKADLLVPEASAAGIIAKVARDEYMARLSLDFPDYGFERHVGYGTKWHLDNLKKYGRCAEHRVTFKPVSVFS